jgi:hypothetical protein
MEAAAELSLTGKVNPVRGVAFLVSDAAAYVSGSEYVIDGANNRVL